MKEKITRDTIRGIRPGRQYDIRDTGQKGLILRVYASGASSYFVDLGWNKVMILGPSHGLTLEQARADAHDALNDTLHGKDPLLEKRRRKTGTLRAFLDGPFKEWASSHHRDAAASITRVCTAFPALLDHPIASINAFTVEKWRSARHKDDIAPTTTNREIALLKGVLSRAVDLGAMPGPNPLKVVKAVFVDPIARVRYLSEPEEQRLLKTLVDREGKMRAARASFNKWRTDRGYKPVPDYPADRYVDHVQPLVLLAMHTGARRGELLALRWRDVDQVSNVVTFRGVTTKTARTRRVPLNPVAAAALKRWRPAAAQPDDVVFPGDDGQPMESLKTAFTHLMTEANITGFRFHDLRHHAASRMVQAGTDLYVVSEILGHQSMTMTRRYAHLRDADKAAAVGRIAEAR